MSIHWEGSIDAAHFIPGHPKCGRLHGHTYDVHIDLAGPISDVNPSFVVDFAVLKEVVHRLDHKTLIAANHPAIVFLEKDDFVLVSWPDGELKLRPDAVVLLPVLDTSSERLSELLAQSLVQLTGGKLHEILVKVSETPRTWATCRLSAATKQAASSLVLPGNAR